MSCWSVLTLLAAALAGASNAHALSDREICATEWRRGNFQVCEKPAATPPTDFAILRNLAGACVEVGDFASALEVYEKIARPNPEDPRTHDDLAGTYSSVRAHADAVTAMETTLALRPPRPGDYRAPAIM